MGGQGGQQVAPYRVAPPHHHTTYTPCIWRHRRRDLPVPILSFTSTDYWIRILTRVEEPVEAQEDNYCSLTDQTVRAGVKAL